jgi:hypothetical protein
MNKFLEKYPKLHEPQIDDKVKFTYHMKWLSVIETGVITGITIDKRYFIKTESGLFTLKKNEFEVILDE